MNPGLSPPAEQRSALSNELLLAVELIEAGGATRNPRPAISTAAADRGASRRTDNTVRPGAQGGPVGIIQSGHDNDVATEPDAGGHTPEPEGQAAGAPTDYREDDPSSLDEARWQLLWVDPRELVIGTNTRSEAALDRAFVGSIKDRGVREPIVVRRDGDGLLVVRKGQRRTLGAVQAGLDRVPVVVEPDPRGDQTAQEIDRIIDQLGENQHRTGLPETDEVAAHQQLLDLGLTAGQIARRTRTGTKRVRTTLAVAGSEQAATAMARYHLTLDQAAVVAEFDEPDVADELVAAAAASPGTFEHVAQRARDARAEAQLRAELAAQLEQAGVRLIDRPGPASRATIRALDQLRPAADAVPGVSLEEAGHAACPGHVAWLEQSWHGDPPVAISYGCQDWVRHGHAERWAGAGQTTTTGHLGRAAGPMSEEQKAERREVITNNRAWLSATNVRLRWLRQFLSRRTAPKDAATWIAVTLADGSHHLRRAMEDQHSRARDLLGLGDTEGQRWYRGCGRAHPIAEAAGTATPARATMLALAVLLAAFEEGTSKDTWRRRDADAVAYLTTLRGWGYELSEVEELVLAGTDEFPGDEDDDAGSPEDQTGEELGQSGDDAFVPDDPEPAREDAATPVAHR
jgi:ParB family transcriptional regulator, chromosome partitioning protein